MRNRIIALLALVLTLIGSGPALAQLPRPLIRDEYDPTKKNKTKLTVTPLFDQLPPSGYFPIRVAIVNDSKLDRSWEFQFTSRDGQDGGGNEMRSSFSVKCEKNDNTEIDLLVPLVTAFYEDMSASISLQVDVRAPAGLRGSNNELSNEYTEDWPALLVSEYLDTHNGSPISSAIGIKLSGGSGPIHTGSGFIGTMGVEFGAAFNPTQMPEDWRSYSGYDFCLLTENDWSDLAPGAKNALLKWTRLGGSLIVYSNTSTTDLATLSIDKSAAGRKGGDFSWGTVQVESIDKSGLLPAEGTVDTILNIPKRTGGNRLHTVRNEFRPNWPLQSVLGSKTAHVVFFIIVLIAFGILVGPVNLFVFAKAGQRHRLFITTPIISLGASAILVVLILFQDGFGGRGERMVLMEIGPDNTAYIAQEQVARTGVLLNTSFTTPEHGYLSPVMIADSRWARITADNRGGGGRYTLDLRENGVKVAGDWFKSRSEHGHIFETIRPTRGRVDLVGSGNTPVVNSTFEFPLESFYYQDPRGGLWAAEDIPQGRDTPLRPAAEVEFNNWLNRERARFGNRNRKRINMVESRKGCFFATTGEAPGVNTLRSIDWSDTHTLITGKVAAP